MNRLLMLVALLAQVAFGQLTLYVVESGSESVLAPNSLYQLRSMESGDSQSVQLRVRNLGSSTATITQFAVDGVGYSLQRPLPPIDLAPGGFVNATLVFTAGAPANYGANLRMNATNVLLLTTVSPGATISVVPSCRGTVSPTIDFGFVLLAETKTCGATLSNETGQTRTITTLAASGAGFSVVGVTLPLTLAAGQSMPFGIQFTAPVSGQFSGALRIENRTYPLAAIGLNPPMPQPIVEFDSNVFGSAQQRRVSVRLAAPAPVSASGTFSFSFQADLPSAADDPAVMFVENGVRTVRFTVEQGHTAVKLMDREFLTIQTGTTAGRLRFTFSGYGPGFTADPTITMTIPAAQIGLDRQLASRFPDRIDVLLVGFDNTFTAGSMNFRFYDTAGNPIGSPIPADFTGAFRAFFHNNPGGSAFKVTISFGVTNGASIGGVEAELSNAAGTIRTSRMRF